MPRGTRIVSEKQHWTQVGYNAALRRLSIEAVTTGKKRIDEYITTGFKKGKRVLDKQDVEKIKVDPDVMEMLADKVHGAMATPMNPRASTDEAV